MLEVNTSNGHALDKINMIEIITVPLINSLPAPCDRQTTCPGYTLSFAP